MCPSVRACVRARMDAAAVSSPMVMVNVQGGRCWDTRAAVRSDWRGYGCLCLGEESWIQVENVGCRRTLAFGRASPLSYAHAASTKLVIFPIYHRTNDTPTTTTHGPHAPLPLAALLSLLNNNNTRTSRTLSSSRRSPLSPRHHPCAPFSHCPCPRPAPGTRRTHLG